MGRGEGFFWFSGIPDVPRSVIFKRKVIVLHYGFDFYRVCGSRKKGIISMCHVEVFRILQGGGSREIISPDPAEMGFIFLKAGFPP